MQKVIWRNGANADFLNKINFSHVHTESHKMNTTHHKFVARQQMSAAM
jgi:hypothetical protein